MSPASNGPEAISIGSTQAAQAVQRQWWARSCMFKKLAKACQEEATSRGWPSLRHTGPLATSPLCHSIRPTVMTLQDIIRHDVPYGFSYVRKFFMVFYRRRSFMMFREAKPSKEAPKGSMAEAKAILQACQQSQNILQLGATPGNALSKAHTAAINQPVFPKKGSGPWINFISFPPPQVLIGWLYYKVEGEEENQSLHTGESQSRGYLPSFKEHPGKHVC
eukprot:scaffold106094_cov20-Tisochrysis_lutea.AAC.1